MSRTTLLQAGAASSSTEIAWAYLQKQATCSWRILETLWHLMQSQAPPFALAWRNYIKSVIQKGFMYRISQAPESLILSENKTLGGREDMTHHGEASGRKLVVSFFKQDATGLVHRVDRDDSIMRLQLLSIAELLQTLGMVLPPDTERSASATELLLERQYLHLNISRYTCTLVAEAHEVHCHRLAEDQDAEAALLIEALPAARTNMMLARLLQRTNLLEDGESLDRAWQVGSLASLQERAAPLLPPVAPAPAGPPGPAAPLRARGAGRGRGRGRARGRGRPG